MTVEMSYIEVIFDSYSLQIISAFSMTRVIKDVFTHIYYINIRITPFTISVICTHPNGEGR